MSQDSSVRNDLPNPSSFSVDNATNSEPVAENAPTSSTRDTSSTNVSAQSTERTEYSAGENLGGAPNIVINKNRVIYYKGKDYTELLPESIKHNVSEKGWKLELESQGRMDRTLEMLEQTCAEIEASGGAPESQSPSDNSSSSE